MARRSSSRRWPCRSACCSRACRGRQASACRPCWALAPLPGLAAALLASGGAPLVLDEAHLQFTLALDPPGAILLGVGGAALDHRRHLCPELHRRGPDRGRFAVWWLLSADRQPRRLHRRRPGQLLCDLRPGQPRGLGPGDPRRHARRAPGRRSLPRPRGAQRDLPADGFRAAGGGHPGQQPRDPATPWRCCRRRPGATRLWPF